MTRYLRFALKYSRKKTGAGKITHIYLNCDGYWSWLIGAWYLTILVLCVFGNFHSEQEKEK